MKLSSPVPAAARSRAGLVQISAAGMLWGTTGVVVQLVRKDVGLDPVSIGFYRLAIAAAGLLVLQARGFRALLASVRVAPVPLVLVGIGLGLYQAAYFLSVAAVGVSISTMVSIGVAPVCVAGWEALVARRRPSALVLVSLGVGVLGLVLITAGGGRTTTGPQHPLFGVVMAVLAGVGYAASTVTNRHLAQRTAALPLTTVSTLLGAVALLPYAVVKGIGFTPHPSPIALLVYVGLGATAVSYAFFYNGLRTTSGSVAAVLTLLEPLTAAVLAVAVLGEPVRGLEVAGGVLLLGAISALYLAPPAGEQPPAPELSAPPL